MELIRINAHGGELPERHGDWIDLSTAEDVEMKAGEWRMISLGISAELPKDTFAMVVPRSSTFKRYGIMLTNSVGIIDNEYCGDEDIWKFPAYAMRDTHIEKGSRIAQFMLFRRMEAVGIEAVDSLGNKNRGGFGSTGK